MSATVNWWGVAFYILIAFIIVIVVAYFVWPNGIIHVALAGGYAWIGQHLPKIDLNGIFSWLKENSVIAGLLVTLGSTALGALVKNYQTGKANKVLDKKLLELETKNLELVNDTSKVDALQAKLKELEADTTASDLQKRINEFGDLKTTYEARIQSLLQQNQELMNRLQTAPRTIEKIVV